ncbi:carboxypeptidase regulatory-like domain-containing protein [Gemmatimonadota bacterium]
MRVTASPPRWQRTLVVLLSMAGGLTMAGSALAQEQEIIYPPFVQFALESCGGIDQPEGQVILVGIVRDSISGIRMAGATTTANWREGEGARSANRAATSVTNTSGYFAFCHVPAGGRVTLRTRALGKESSPVAVRLTEMLVQKQDLVLALGTGADPSDPSGVFGRIMDRDTNVPVEGAEVSLSEGVAWTLTNQMGRFTFEDVPAGNHVIEIKHLSYGTREYPINVAAGGGAQVDIALSKDPIELEPIVVTAQSAAWVRTMSGFFERMERGLGHFVTPEDLAVSRPSSLGDAIHSVPGVRLLLRNDPESRGRNRYMIVLQSAIRMRGTQAGPCAALVFIDGMQVGRNSGDPAPSDFDPSDVAGGDIAAIEIYRGASELPAEFAGSESGCGVVVVWTKR